MFVSRLDRPWIKTPFALEGMKITSQDDIERLRKYCSYVHVDAEQGVSPRRRYWVNSDVPKAQTSTKVQQLNTQTIPDDDRWECQELRKIRRFKTQPSHDNEHMAYQELRKETYQNSREFTVEVKSATNISRKISNNYKRLLKDLRRGRDLDLNAVKAGVSDMVESVVRNPAAMMWVVQLKKLDEYTYSRALGTSVWCATFGRHLGLEKTAINQLALGGLLLDIGKSLISQSLLKKAGELSNDELKDMQDHVDLGLKILVRESSKLDSEKLDFDVLQMVASHHERADGSGYPQGLENQDIPIFGRIAGIVDSYDAMTSERPYSGVGPYSPHQAIAELYELKESKFHAELVEQFIQTVGLYPIGSLVELSTGQVGAVVETNGLRRLKPSLMLLLDENKEPYAEFEYLDLSSTSQSIEVTKGLSPGAYGIDMQELFL